jgi:hypothetical protein
VNTDSEDAGRCTDPEQGIKVLSYDLLEGEERAQVDAHLEVCRTCRDLRDQVFGDEGAFRELEYRAFKLSQRQKVPASAWLAERLRDLWLPFAVFVVLASLFALWLITRAPDVAPVALLRLQAFRAATLDTTSTVLVPRLAPGIESIVVETDQDAWLLVYETNDETLQRLLPGGDIEAPLLRARSVEEFALPPLQSAESRMVLVIVPGTVAMQPGEWDRALLKHFGGSGEINLDDPGRHWPQDAVPTMRWLQ